MSKRDFFQKNLTNPNLLSDRVSQKTTCNYAKFHGLIEYIGVLNVNRHSRPSRSETFTHLWQKPPPNVQPALRANVQTQPLYSTIGR